MKDQAPELFDNQPDIMHHLVTTMSPTILMKNGIPVCDNIDYILYYTILLLCYIFSGTLLLYASQLHCIAANSSSTHRLIDSSFTIKKPTLNLQPQAAIFISPLHGWNS